MPDTARRYELVVSCPSYDERLDVEKSTRAAVRCLGDADAWRFAVTHRATQTARQIEFAGIIFAIPGAQP